MEKNELDLHHSTLNMVSFGFGSLSREYLRIAFSAYAFFYYETEIGLDSWMVALSFILFAVWTVPNEDNKEAKYIGQVYLAIDYYSNFFQNDDIILNCLSKTVWFQICGELHPPA